MTTVLAARQLTGMPAFVGLRAGQVASLTGSVMTRFALGLWAWERTRQATVFALVSLCSFGAAAVAGPVAGMLADRVFAPAMRPGGALAPLFGPLVGVGRSAGLALMATLAGLLMLAICLGAWLTPAIREVEVRVPDHIGGQG